MPHNKSRKERQKAFEKPGLGQFKPGELSKKSSRGDGRSVAPSVESRFIPELSAEPRVRPKVEITQSAAFAAKLEQARREESLSALQSQSPQPLARPQEVSTSPFPPEVSSEQTEENAKLVLGEPVKAGEPPLPKVGEAAELAVFAGSFLGFGGLSLLGKAQTTASKLLTVGKTGLVKNAVTTGEKIAVNTATAKATKSWIQKLLFELGRPKVIAGTVAAAVLTSVGSYPFAGYDRGEALRSLDATWKTAYFADDDEGMVSAEAMIDEFNNPDLWTQIHQWVPFANIREANLEVVKASVLQNQVNEKARKSRELKKALGEDDKSTLKREKAEENAAYEESRQRNRELDLEFTRLEIDARKRANDEFNLERLETEEKVQGLKLRTSDIERQNRRRAIEEEAAFWAEQRRLRAEKEAEERQAISDFWCAYRKKLLELQDDNRPSKLGFGLFR